MFFFLSARVLWIRALMSRGYFTVVGEEVDSFSRKADDAAVHRVPYMEIESWRAWQCGCCCESSVGW